MNWKTQVMPGPVRMISKVASTFSSSAFFWSTSRFALRRTRGIALPDIFYNHVYIELNYSIKKLKEKVLAFFGLKLACAVGGFVWRARK